MKKYLSVILVLISMTFHSKASSTDDINQSIMLYCGSDSLEYQQEIVVGDGVKISLQQNGFQQIQSLEFKVPEKTLIKRELSNIQVSNECSEFLFDHASIKLKESGEIISRIYFNFDDSLLTERSKYTLDQIFNRIKENNRHLTVIGHTDSRGSKEYNYQLGLKRSHGTMEYLIKNGVESSRFTAVSKGEMEPVVSNDTSDGREKNRRVDIHM